MARVQATEEWFVEYYTPSSSREERYERGWLFGHYCPERKELTYSGYVGRDFTSPLPYFADCAYCRQQLSMDEKQKIKFITETVRYVEK